MDSDPKTIRLNDGGEGGRLAQFERAIKTAGADGNEVIRQLTDAYVRYVAEHGHSPTFPVSLVSAILPQKKH